MEQKTEKTIHRVGTLTSGISLIVFGTLFLFHMFVPDIDFILIFRFWPCILILLGVEILVGNYKKANEFIYDKGSVVLMILLMVFALVMGVINEWLMRTPMDYISFHR